MIDIDNIENLHKLITSYRRDRKRFVKLSEKSMRDDLTRNQSQKNNADMNWAAMELDKLEHQIHALCVDAGLADVRSNDAYGPITYQPSGFHLYVYNPPKPKRLEQSA